MHHLQRSKNKHVVAIISAVHCLVVHRAMYLLGLAKSYHYFQLKCREPILSKSEKVVSSDENTARQKHNPEQLCGK